MKTGDLRQQQQREGKEKIAKRGCIKGVKTTRTRTKNLGGVGSVYGN